MRAGTALRLLWTGAIVALAGMAALAPSMPALGQARGEARGPVALYREAVKLVFDGKFDEGLLVIDKLKGALQQAPDPELANAALQDLRARAYHGQGRHSEAVGVARTALAIFERRLPADHVDVGHARETLVNALSALERIDEAVAEAARNVEAFERAKGRDAPQLAGLMIQLAGLRVRQGRIGEAARLSERARAICERAPSADNAFCGFSYSQLGQIKLFQGQMREAVELMERAVELFDRHRPGNQALKATALLALGQIYYSVRRIADARTVVQRAIAIHERLGGALSLDLAGALAQLADIERITLDYAASERLNRRALAILEKWPGRREQLAGIVLANLAADLMLQKRLSEAEAMISRSAALLSRASSKDTAGHTAAHTALARLRLEQGRYAEAADLLGVMERSMLRLFPADHPTFIDHYVDIGRVEARQNRWAPAVASYRKAVRIALASQTYLSGGVDEIAVTSRQDYDPFLVLAIAASRLADKGEREGRVLADEALTAAQHAQLSRAGLAVANMAARLGSRDDALARAIRQLQDLEARIVADEKELVGLIGIPDAAAAEIEAVRRRIRETRAQHGAERRRIEGEFPRFAALANPKPLAIAEIQRLLREDEALIVYLPHTQGTIAWAVTREQAQVRSLTVTSHAIETSVTAMRRSLDIETLRKSLKSGATARDVLFDLESAQELHRALIAPLEAVIAGKQSWLVVPSGALTSLPFHLLVSGPTPVSGPPGDVLARYRHARWLVRRHAISVLPAVQSLAALRGVPAPSRAAKPMVGFGDPMFDTQPARTRAAKGGKAIALPQRAAAIDLGVTRAGRRVDLAQLRKGLPALPDTARELREVARVLGASSDDLLLGARATVPAVKSMQLAAYRIVYFATHGLVAGEISGLAEPALAMTIPREPREDDNGLLTASDIAQLELDADWVVLSACNTAAGDRAGAEGLSGLARAFFYAGARALLVSHWAVESVTAVRLTTRTFTAMAADSTLGRAEALRRAMIAEIDDPSNPLGAYPGLWAPFVVAGESGR